MDSGYSGNTVGWAVLGTILAPWLTLILALVALNSQADPAKHRQLRLWAWASGVWLVVAFVGAYLLATL